MRLLALVIRSRVMDHNERQIRDKKGRQEKFLASIRGEVGKAPGSIRAACEAAGVARKTFYLWRDEDPEFLEQFEACFEDGTDTLEDIAHARVVDGVVVGREYTKDGELIGEKIQHDNALLKLLLSARRPARYGRGDVQVAVQNNFTPPDDNQVARALSLLLARAQVAKQVT